MHKSNHAERQIEIYVFRSQHQAFELSKHCYVVCLIKESLKYSGPYIVVNKTLVVITPYAIMMVLYNVLVKTIQIIPTKLNTTCLLRFD